MKLLARCVRCYSTKPELPKCDFKPKPYKGLGYDEMTNIRKTHVNPALTTYYTKPLALHQGYKQWLFDIEGNRYLDMYGGVCTVSVGHCHPKITSAMKDQMDTLGHSTNIYYQTKIHEYAKKLADKLPGNLEVSIVFYII
uniref:Alanine--glyoxylate aminotransferase 2, mitochondrial n=1 Tax=Diabrotica virgifera virgifera TaxID=50390 RepID=A0A6P7G2Q2_DIAVI